MIYLFVPLAVALVLSIVVVAAFVSPRVERLVEGLALSIFGRYVSRESARRDAQVKRMRAALVGGTSGNRAGDKGGGIHLNGVATTLSGSVM